MASKPLVESVICNICNNIVLSSSIFCDLCETWIHTYCLKFNKKSITILSKDESEWYCPTCLGEHIPFSNSTNNYITSLSYNSSISNVVNKCSSCNLNIINSSQSVKCYIGKHYFHMKCVSFTKSKLKNIHKWNCENCNLFPFNKLDNNEFLEYNSIKPIQVVNKSIFKKSNRSLNFSNFNNYPKLSISSPGSESEENSEINFDFYDNNQFNKLTSTIKNNLFSIFHTNIRSYNKNFEQLSVLLGELMLEFDVIGLTETWHTKASNFIPKNIQNYHCYAGESQNSGCGLYIKNNINYKSRNDLSISLNNKTDEFESLFIEVLNQNTSNIIVGVIYRHPTGNITTFTNYLKTIFNITNKENKQIIIMGDFNIDLLKFEDQNGTSDFIEIMLSNFLQPFIIQPTRITENGNYSLIDNIFYNKIDSECTSGNILSHVSDHLPNFLLIQKISITKSLNKKLKRDFQTLT